MIRVVIADDNAPFRDGMQALLHLAEDIEVVGSAADGVEAVRLARTLQPDVIVMDLEMPGGDGVQATREIAPDNPQIAVLLFTMHEDDASVMAAMQAGARGYVVKGVRKDQLLSAIRTVADGGAVFGPGLARRMVDIFAAAAHGAAATGVLAELTDRERQVLDLIARGSSNEQIAERLALTRGTVRNYASSIFSKLQVGDRSHAIVKAREAGIGGR